ncbi:hypothetical protein HWQ46_01745 [Shewanella sp. D64]|uniref:hypothetical protein n=1 Tax=unclassified Shewanella TaxID=196818 RepID=UPI0022BA57AD|nr:MULTISPECIES: hypothetical protein [unclassified Shewanella]MEC4724270.1 hypothetical protein [Shewanella sp. D64]MEC4738782.1 hypothetical protein [Shewanella sp. E94]WBJ97778.1 hypothetical protein HWQ47_12110 [Shewanella sp. MTB7]
MNENHSKTNVDLTAKGDIKVDISPTQNGADIFLKIIGLGLSALCVFSGVAWVISALAPNGIF